ncbi:hypothetical protein OK18_07205 [Chryseobacterium gallinarum]|uniref:Uncharacterized protein n=2 Tax=Chryseobacterium TaxID=59732 RepID=A0A0G3M332_CHRGL|nr:hypothetical protein [Chryseobacterium gallinarum]AKK72443.1 hypothetical protein OK18_07205 [Chryseobacterium gallinarum]MCL8536041.1 hypothetical protein [Chryseobacterium gallinarum]
MKPPVTYADWADLFERFGKGEEVAEAMNSGRFELDAGTAQRFYARAEEGYRARKKLWLDNFQRNFTLENIRTIEELEFVLQNNKKTLAALSGFAYSKGLPKELRENFTNDFKAFVSEFKKTLKDNTGKDNKDREKMLMVINSFNMNEVPQDPIIDEYKDSTPSTGRKIIF